MSEKIQLSFKLWRNSLFVSARFDKLPVPENSKRNIFVWKPLKVWDHRCAALNSKMNGWRRSLPSWRESFLNPFAPLSALLYWYQTNINNIANVISHLIFWYISGIKSYSLTLCQLNNKNVAAFVIGNLKYLNKDQMPQKMGTKDTHKNIILILNRFAPFINIVLKLSANQPKSCFLLHHGSLVRIHRTLCVLNCFTRALFNMGLHIKLITFGLIYIFIIIYIPDLLENHIILNQG